MPENGIFFKQSPTTQQQVGWLVQDLFKRNRQSMAGGYPGDGKSLLNQILLYCIAYEAPFADIFPVTGGDVMLIDSENEWDILKTRTDKIKKGLEMDSYTKKHRIWWEYRPNFLLDDDTTWQPILKVIDDVKPVIISLDHLARFHQLDENITNQMSKVNTGSQALMDRQGSSLRINHHFNKTDIKGSFLKRLRGSSALLANTDIAFEVRPVSRKRIGEEVFLEKVGLIFQPRKEPTPTPIVLRIEEGKDYMKLHYEGEYQPIEDPRMDEVCHKLYHGLFLEKKGVWSIADVEKDIGKFADLRELRHSFDFMEHKLDLVTSTRKGSVGGKFRYSLNNPSGASKLTCPWCKEVFRV